MILDCNRIRWVESAREASGFFAQIGSDFNVFNALS